MGSWVSGCFYWCLLCSYCFEPLELCAHTCLLGCVGFDCLFLFTCSSSPAGKRALQSLWRGKQVPLDQCWASTSATNYQRCTFCSTNSSWGQQLAGNATWKKQLQEDKTRLASQTIEAYNNAVVNNNYFAFSYIYIMNNPNSTLHTEYDELPQVNALDACHCGWQQQQQGQCRTTRTKNGSKNTQAVLCQLGLWSVGAKVCCYWWCHHQRIRWVQATASTTQQGWRIGWADVHKGAWWDSHQGDQRSHWCGPTGRKWRWILKSPLLWLDEIQVARGSSGHAIS